MERQLTLLSNASATSADFLVQFGGEYTFTADGTFGGATVTLQIKGPGGTYFSAGTDAALTAAGACVVALGSGMTVRVLVAGGSPSGLYAMLRGVN